MRVTYDRETDKAWIQLADPMPKYGLVGMIFHEHVYGVGVMFTFDSHKRLVEIELRGVSRRVHSDLIDAAEPA